MADERSTKPGTKRLWITITTVLPFIVGIPLWLNSTQVYRAPLPLKEIDELGSWASVNPLYLPCRLNIIFASTDEFLTKAQLDSIASSITAHVQILISGSYQESCQSGFDVQVKHDTEKVCLTSRQSLGSPGWPCGLVKYGFLNSAQLTDDILDNLLWNYGHKEEDPSTENANESRDEGGLYTVVVLRKSQIQSIDFSSEDDVSGGGCENEYNSICKSKSGWSTVVGKYRHAWIIGDFDSTSVESEVVPRIGDVALTFLRGSRSSSESSARSLPLSADGEAILSFSLLNAEPNDWIFDWDFEELKRQFFQPVVEALNGIARLTIESQVLYYTPKAVKSQWDALHNAHVVPVKQLPFFVNSNEWHLDSSSAAAGRSKLLHFAIYVPGAKEYPLHFLRRTGQLSPTNGFTSPHLPKQECRTDEVMGWGGVVVYNPKNISTISSDYHSSTRQITPKEFESIAGVIIAQIRSLFGLPPVLSDDQETGFFSLSAVRTGFAEWELDLLMRRRAISDMASASSTLMSLSRLVQKLPSMVIMDEIGEQVKSSLSAAAAARERAAHGAYLSTAEAACKAASLAEAAFFQPSIMSVLYNPTEHHLAIYTPFFVPVLLHAVLAVIKEASRYRREWKRFKQKKE